MNEQTLEIPYEIPADAINPVEPFLRMERMPHIWCPGCGIGTTVNCFTRALLAGHADLDKVEPLILGTLEKLARDGIDRGTIEASLNTIEFALRVGRVDGSTGEAVLGRSYRTLERTLTDSIRWWAEHGTIPRAWVGDLLVAPLRGSGA